MSTHATIGVKFPDGTISGCYVHYDGGSITPRLVDFLKKKTATSLVVLIAEAQRYGGIRSFHTPPAEYSSYRTAETDFLDDNESYTIDENNWDDDHMGASYRYLVDYDTGTVWSESKY